MLLFRLTQYHANFKAVKRKYMGLAVDQVQAPSRLLYMHIQAYLLAIPV